MRKKIRFIILLGFISFFLLDTVVAQNTAANKKLAGDKVLTGVFNYDLATQILDETNRYREAEGREPLKMTKLLCDMAMLRAA